MTDLQFVRSRSAAEQIADHLRQQILTGELSPGAKLPSTHGLARRWGTHVATVHEGLQRLTKEGLLLRRLRLGTIVRPHEERLTKVAIYQTANGSGSSFGPFVGALAAGLEAATHREHVEISFVIDRRPEAEQGTPLPQLTAMVAAHEVQAVIALSATARSLPWLRQLPVPAAFQCSAVDPRTVSFDFRQLAELSVAELARQGCRTVGLIGSIDLRHPDLPGSTFHRFYQNFQDVAAESGLAMQPDWCRTPGPTEVIPMSGHARFGYQQFQALWQLAERPAGLIVYPDGVAQGVIAAVLATQVRVPEQLRLVLHRNAEIHWLCPVPAAFVVSRAGAVVEGLLGQIMRQLRGEHCELQRVGYQLETATPPAL